MTSIPRSQVSYASKSVTAGPTHFDAKQICLIVSFTCLAGFIIDILVIGLPPNPFAPQWRLNFLQQVSERSLLLFIGVVLLVFSQLEHRIQGLRVLSISCIFLGILFGLSGLLVIEDNLALQRQAEENINTQATELRSRIVQGRDDEKLRQQIAPEAFTEALRSVQTQTESLQQETKTGAMKTLISSAGNLFLVAVGLLGVARIGLTKALSSRRQRPSYLN